MSDSLLVVRVSPKVLTELGALPRLFDTMFVVATTLLGRSGDEGAAVRSGDSVGRIDGRDCLPYFTTFLRRSADVKLETREAMLSVVAVVVLSRPTLKLL